MNKYLILLAHPTRFERVTFAFGGFVFKFAPVCAHLQKYKKPVFYNGLSMDVIVSVC